MRGTFLGAPVMIRKYSFAGSILGWSFSFGNFHIAGTIWRRGTALRPTGLLDLSV